MKRVTWGVCVLRGGLGVEVCHLLEESQENVLFLKEERDRESGHVRGLSLQVEELRGTLEKCVLEGKKKDELFEFRLREERGAHTTEISLLNNQLKRDLVKPYEELEKREFVFQEKLRQCEEMHLRELQSLQLLAEQREHGFHSQLEKMQSQLEGETEKRVAQQKKQSKVNAENVLECERLKGRIQEVEGEKRGKEEELATLRQSFVTTKQLSRQIKSEMQDNIKSFEKDIHDIHSLHSDHE